MEALSQRHLATQSAYTSTSYVEQPQYVSPTPPPRITLLRGSTARGVEKFQVGNQRKTVMGSGKGAAGHPAGARLPRVLSWDTATPRGGAGQADAAARLSPELGNAGPTRGLSRVPGFADVGPWAENSHLHREADAKRTPRHSPPRPPGVPVPSAAPASTVSGTPRAPRGHSSDMSVSDDCFYSLCLKGKADAPIQTEGAKRRISCSGNT